MADDNRERREFWTVPEGGTSARRVVGLSCGPDHPHCWWVPEMGFSGTIGIHLFDTPRAAMMAEIAACEKRIDHERNRLSALRANAPSPPEKQPSDKRNG